MPLETLLQNYGYIAVFLGTILEGETILILAGFASHRGYLDFPIVCAVAFLGGFLGDQFYFYLGKQKGQKMLARRPEWQDRVEKVNFYLRKYQVWLLLGFRFFYGTRTMVPFALGMSDIRVGRFVLFNAISGMVWAVLIAGAGYFFGSAIEAVFGDIRRYEEYIMGGLVLAGLTIWLIRRIKKRNIAK